MADVIYPTEPNLSPSWGMHDPHIFRDPLSGAYYLYCTHQKAFRSKDLRWWDTLEGTIPAPAEDISSYTEGGDVWAPDVVYTQGEYRMYCSVSRFGKQHSALFLAVAQKPEGPFLPRATVLTTKEGDPCNAIDAGIITDAENGRMYMVFGSFWQGIYMVELDPVTGLVKGYDGAAPFDSIKDLWHIASRPASLEGAVEGAYIVYQPQTKYYYLFTSYGSLNSDYHIRVGRSRCITGPYLDPAGRDMVAPEDYSNQVGLLLAGGYLFEGDRTGYMAPGHNSVLADADGSWYLVHHVRPHNYHHFQMSYLQIRRLYWNSEGWPVASPEVYAGEELQEVDASLIPGGWDYLKFRSTLPQGLTTSVRLLLKSDGTGSLADSVPVTWELEATAEGDKKATCLVLHYADLTDRILLTPLWDQENKTATLGGTGTDSRQTCLWIKKFRDET